MISGYDTMWSFDGIVSFIEYCYNIRSVYAVECGGKMHLREAEYEKAHTDFFEAFKNYDESGSPRFAGFRFSVYCLVNARIFLLVS